MSVGSKFLPPAIMDLPSDVAPHLFDVHCHPTDSRITPDSIKGLRHNICAMSTSSKDQTLVAELARSSPRVIPCFGYHPWFTHFITLHDTGVNKETHYRTLLLGDKTDDDLVSAFNRLLPLLPEPTPLSEILNDIRHNLESFPNAMLGEVGFDRAFKVAFDYWAEPRELTPFRIPFEHQLAVLESQIDLAVSMRRNISLHSVKCPSQTEALLTGLATKHGVDKWLSISLDLHSCGLSSELLRMIQRRHPNVFLSLSKVINGRSDNHKALIASCPSNRLLAESDYNNIERSAEQTWEIAKTIAEIKGWSVEQGWNEDILEVEWGVVRHLEENWKLFEKGKHQIAQKRSPKQ